MKQKNGVAIVVALALVGAVSYIAHIENKYSYHYQKQEQEETTTKEIQFSKAGKVTKVDLFRDEIYVDTSKKGKGSDIYIMYALQKIPFIPKRGDSIHFNVDPLSNKIDTFVVVQN